MLYYNKSLIIFFIFMILIEPCSSFPHLALRSILDRQQPSQYPFQAPGPNDIRGPCPGLNTAANHGYIDRSGITNFNELVTMQQELYNIGLDLAIFLATTGVVFDGDVITGKLSIGKQTSAIPGITNTPGGLNAHNVFEGDVSLTRNDYYLANGDNYEFNGTLYGMMFDEAQNNDGLYNRKTMGDYRFKRYQQSLSENGQFVFLQQQFLLYGAASFLYEVFPNGTDMLPTETVISSFFGAQSTGNGEWTSVPEQIPPNWIKRQTPYVLADITPELLGLYLAHPVLFGGNTGQPNTFVPNPLQLSLDQQTPNGVACFLYQTILAQIPTEINAPIIDSFVILNFLTSKLDPIFSVQFGCPSTSFNRKK